MICEHPFALFCGGAETSHWRKVLREGEATHVALNFRLLKPTKAQFLLSEKFPDNQEVLLDGGGFGAKPDADHDRHQQRYQAFVEANIERAALVVEYDAVDLEWVKRNRMDFWDDLSLDHPGRFVPVWREEHGIDELEALCHDYERVGVVKPERNLESKLRALQASTGVKLHGVGITRYEDMTRIPYASVSSTSWISPTRYGDTQVWVQNRWHWYPVGSQESARKRHAVDFMAAGFDAQKIIDGENSEVSAYTLWAWRQYEGWLQSRRSRGNVVAIRPGVDSEDLAGHPAGNALPVDRPSDNLPERPAEKISFPGLAQQMQKVTNPQEGGPDRVPVVRIGDSGLRHCDSCVLAQRCAMRRPGASCAYNMPVQISTPEQLAASMQGVLEMQLSRIIFARAAEEADGGPADPLVSKEIQLYFDIIEKMKEIQEDTTWIRIEAKGAQAASPLAELMKQVLDPQVGAAAQQIAEDNRRIDPDKADRWMADIIDVDPEEDQ